MEYWWSLESPSQIPSRLFNQVTKSFFIPNKVPPNNAPFIYGMTNNMLVFNGSCFVNAIFFFNNVEWMKNYPYPGCYMGRGMKNSKGSKLSKKGYAFCNYFFWQIIDSSKNSIVS